jgi:hypothetical protein
MAVDADQRGGNTLTGSPLHQPRRDLMEIVGIVMAAASC